MSLGLIRIRKAVFKVPLGLMRKVLCLRCLWDLLGKFLCLKVSLSLIKEVVVCNVSSGLKDSLGNLSVAFTVPFGLNRKVLCLRCLWDSLERCAFKSVFSFNVFGTD